MKKSGFSVSKGLKSILDESSHGLIDVTAVYGHVFSYFQSDVSCLSLSIPFSDICDWICEKGPFGAKTNMLVTGIKSHGGDISRNRGLLHH